MAGTGSRRKDLPKIGHGGTLDPFATGLLIVCVGKAVKLARYFLGSHKTYEGVIRFGETTLPGDPTAPVTETSDRRPESLAQLQEFASRLTKQPYLQTPPMHSAKKQGGKALYELAREGIEVEREAKLCHLYRFDILDYADSRASFRVECSSGTYIRTLAQDLSRMLGTVGLLEKLHRVASGDLSIVNALTTDQIAEATVRGKTWDQLDCWIPFDRLLDGYSRAEATPGEAAALRQGKQNVLVDVIARCEHDDSTIAIYCASHLVAVARREEGFWGLERVFA